MSISHLRDLKPDPANRRKHNPRNIGTIVDALHSVGAARSIVIDENGVVLAGNGVVEAAAEAGIERVRVVEADGEEVIAVRRVGLSADQKRKLALYDNRAGELAEWDVDQLLRDVESGLDFKGIFDGAELDALIAQVTPSGGNGGDPDELPPTAPERCALGEVWELGDRHRLLCGDATKAEDVSRLMGDDAPGLIFADPPYGISIVSVKGHLNSGAGAPFRGARGHVRNVTSTPRAERSWGNSPPTVPVGGPGGKGLGAVGGSKPFGKVAGGTAGKTKIIPAGVYAVVLNDDSPETAAASATLLLGMFPKACHVWWGGNFYADRLPASSCWLVWDKEITANFADAELAWTNQPTAVRLFRHQWNGLMRDSERGEKRIHPTQKPVALALWCFERYGEAVDVMLDPFAGSGMSLMAAEQAGKTWRGLELSPPCCDLILARWEAATGKTACLVT